MYNEVEQTELKCLVMFLDADHEGNADVGTAEAILAATGGLSGLMSLDFDGLSSLPGFGPTMARRLWVLEELVRRSRRNYLPTVLNDIQDVNKYLSARCSGWTVEHFGLLVLNSRMELVADVIISKGSSKEARVSSMELFREALRNNADGIIVYHNHPSSNVDPSQQDINFTHCLLIMGSAVDIKIYDHIIVGDEGICYNFCNHDFLLDNNKETS